MRSADCAGTQSTCRASQYRCGFRLGAEGTPNAPLHPRGVINVLTPSHRCLLNQVLIRAAYRYSSVCAVGSWGVCIAQVLAGVCVMAAEPGRSCLPFAYVSVTLSRGGCMLLLVRVVRKGKGMLSAASELLVFSSGGLD